MIPVIPWHIVLIVVATNVTIAVAVWHILSSAARRSALSPVRQRAVRGGVALFLCAWLGAALLLAPAPSSLLGREPFYITPLIPLFGTIPMAIALVALWRSPTLRDVLEAASLPALIGVQFYRTIGVVFLILLAQKQLPGYFALPAGSGDVAIGLAAPLVALALARGVPGAPMMAIAWNGLGLVDLLGAVGTGFLAPLLAPHLGPHAPAAALGVFPLLLVPAFAVPIAVLLHLLAIRGSLREVHLRPAQLRSGPRSAPQLSTRS